jgi:hypothetical protein
MLSTPAANPRFSVISAVVSDISQTSTGPLPGHLLSWQEQMQTIVDIPVPGSVPLSFKSRDQAFYSRDFRMK